jgi:excisionase family DNA binding protein
MAGLFLAFGEQAMAILCKSDLLSREEAARYLGVAPATLATWATTKRYPLPMVKIGRVVKYRQRDLDAFIESRTTGTPE